MMLLVVSTTTAILTSAMCSLLEAVLYSVPISHIESLAHEGRASGRILRKLRKEVHRPISAILSLNTIANTAGAAVAGAAAAAVFGQKWLAWFSAAFTLAVLMFSEVMPKTAGVVYARPLAAIIARPLQLLVWTFTPFVWLCGLMTRLVSHRSPDQTVSDQELIVMARLGRQAGTIDPDELDVIENILELENKKATEVMTPRPVMVALDQRMTVEQARNEKGVLSHGRFPVFDKTPDDVVGVAHRRDILAAMADGMNEMTVAELMRPAHFVTTTTTLDRILKQFLERRQHMLVVIDEHGGVAGIVTLEDVLEEILGREIMDEFDEVEDLRETARRRREKLLKGH